MSRVNFVHDFDDHDLRGFIHVSSFAREIPALRVLLSGLYYTAFCVKPVKVDGKKDSLYNPLYKQIHGTISRSWSPRTSIFLTGREKNACSVFEIKVWKGFMRGGEAWLMLVR